jgi:hypothetical protein
LRGRILAIHLYGTAVVFEEFGGVIAPGGAALVISSMAGYMLPALPPEQDQALANTPADELLALPFLQPAPSRTRVPRTRCRNARTICAYRPKPCAGPSVARA